MEDERTKTRRESQELLDALRGDPSVSPRAWELFENILARLLRLETGSFGPEETPTKPARRLTEAPGREDPSERADPDREPT